MISNASKEALKTTADIVDTISNYIELKKAGANFKAPCPFHGEKTASFVVSPQKQICHCFGCGCTYDVFGFVQEFKKISFSEAVEEVANEYNFTLQYENNSSAKDYSKLMEATKEFYLQQKDEKIQEYLRSRGLSEESITAFELGYAPVSKEQLKFFQEQLFNTNELIECGICATDDKGTTYARLSKRISFPIRNHNNKLIGFGGRIIEGDRAKYINSPQTPLFDKSRNFYGYNIAKNAIYDKGTFTITEGYLDVIMMHQAGIKTAVATMGTALTEQHVNIIKKVQAVALLCFDGDKAGVNAAIKASRLLSAHDVFGGVVIFPEGKDPAEMIKDGKKGELLKLMKTSTPLIKFVLLQIAAKYKLNIPKEKQEALKETNEYLYSLSPLMQDEHKLFASKVLNVNIAHICSNSVPQQPSEQNMNFGYINISEMNIINTAAQSRENLELVLDVLDESMFKFHKHEFEMLINEDERLQGVLLRDELSIYSYGELIEQIQIMKIDHLQRKLQELAASKMEFERQLFEIKKIKGEIYECRKKLKGGRDART